MCVQRGRIMEAESSIKTSVEQTGQEVELEQRSTLLMAAAQENVEQQPTQEIDLEQQSTLLMAAAQKDIEQQPTQEIAVEQHHPDQQATLPMAFKPGRRFSRAPHMLLLLWLGAILVAGLLFGAAVTAAPRVGASLALCFIHKALPTLPVDT